jgi:ABC-2 type transport system permease protein
MTLFRLGLRSHRTGIVVMSIMSTLAGALNAAAFVQLAGDTPAERMAFGREMEILGKQLAFLLPDPVQLDTLAGYLTWRAFGFLGLIFAIWAVLASSGIARGEEERGLTEHWLATGVPRVRWLLMRATTFAVGATAALAVALGLTALAAAASGEPLPIGPLVLEGIVRLGLTLAAFGIGLFVAQLVLTRSAAGAIGAIVIVGLYELDAAGRAGMEIGALANLSPFSLAARSAPLLQRGVDVGATIALYGVAAVLIALCTVAFIRRDIGGALFRFGSGATGRAARRPSADPLLRLPVLALVDQQRWWLIGWTAGLVALAYFLTTLARTIVDSMMGIASLRLYFDRLGVAAYSDFVGVLWFGTGLFILSALTVAQVSSWAADDGEGRLEAALASGASRGRIVVERIIALLVIVAIVAAVSAFVVYATASALEITLPGDRMVLATALEIPVVFAFAGIGAALVGWRPRIAVLILGAVAVVSYFLQQFAAVFDWPEWLGRLSIYQLYGRPLSTDDWAGTATLVAIGVAGTAVALVAMRRRDVGT